MVNRIILNCLHTLLFVPVLFLVIQKICNAFEKGIVLWAGLMITFLYKSTTKISEYKIYKVLHFFIRVKIQDI